MPKGRPAISPSGSLLQQVGDGPQLLILPAFTHQGYAQRQTRDLPVALAGWPRPAHAEPSGFTDLGRAEILAEAKKAALRNGDL